MNLIHASCVALEDFGVLIRGKSGSGKSTLSLELIDKNYSLVSDDYCQITTLNGSIIASPPENIKGKIEIRGYGIIKLPYQENVRVRLVVDLKENIMIERHCEDRFCKITNIEIPRIFLDGKNPFSSSIIRILSTHITKKLGS